MKHLDAIMFTAPHGFRLPFHLYQLRTYARGMVTRYRVSSMRRTTPLEEIFLPSLAEKLLPHPIGFFVIYTNVRKLFVSHSSY